jgi:hypothetical protein
MTCGLWHDFLMTPRASARVEVDQAFDRIGSPTMREIMPSYKTNDGGVLTIMVSTNANA